MWIITHSTMQRKFGALVILLFAANAFLICECHPGAPPKTANSPPEPTSLPSSSSGNMSVDSSSTKGAEMDFSAIMKKCNESFPLTMDYLSELNNTGSFPDETDKGPMCYVKCYLEGVGIISGNGSVNTDLAASMLWPNSMDAIDDCVKEQDGIFDKDANGECETAYYLTRCVMLKELLSTRTAAVS